MDQGPCTHGGFRRCHRAGLSAGEKSVADYLVDAPADAKLTDKLNLEDMVFDYAGEFVDRMMEESEQIRNAITEPLA